MHAMSSCFIGGSSNDTPVAGTAHHHRRAAQIRPIEQFDRHEERIHVDMEDRGAWSFERAKFSDPAIAHWRTTVISEP